MAGGIRATICCGVMLLAPLVALADDTQDLKKQFLAAYEPGSRSLREFYGNARIRSRYAWRESSGDLTISESVYMAREPLYRLDTIREDASQQTLIAAPSQFAYTLFRPRGRDRFQLQGVSTDHDHKLESIRQYSPIPFFSYCTAYNLPILEAVREPLFNVRTFQYELANGERLARLDFEWVTESAGKSWTKRGWILFAPDDSWALRESRVGTVGRSVRRIHYQGRHGKVPLIRRLTLWDEDKDGNRLGRDGKQIGPELEAEVLEIVPGPVPEKEFTLAAFGLSDTGLQTTIPPWFYFQLVAVVALAASILLWRLARRRRLSKVPLD